MKNTTTLILSITALLLQSTTYCWGGVPPNPTSSDAEYNTAGGTGALAHNTSSNSNTAFGFNALTSNTIGTLNSALGTSSLSRNMTGSFNTASGSAALSNNTEGNSNTAVGINALYANSTGSNNTASGAGALVSNTTGGGNTSSGANALASNLQGYYNTANGYNSLLYTTNGNNNTANGAYALYSNLTGGYNTASGVEALYNNESNYNTASGYGALRANTTGSNNTAFGTQALLNLETGNNNLALGVGAGKNAKRSNNIYLSNVGQPSDTGTIRIGSKAQTRTFLAGVRGRTTDAADAVVVVIDSNGQLGTISSSERFKQDIRDMNEASHRLLALRPVVYHYKQASNNGKNPLEYGLIAEEVAKVYPELIAHDADGNIETVQYHKLTPMLLNEVQRLYALVQSEKDKNQAQAAANQAQEQEIIRLKRQIALDKNNTSSALAMLQQQVALLTTQTLRFETLATRLSKEALGIVEKNKIKPVQNPS